MRRKGFPERTSPFGDRSRLRRSVHRKCATSVMRRNSCAVECAKVSGVSNNLHLTRHAVDGGESARFLASLWLWIFSVSTRTPLSAPPPLIPTVGLLSVLIRKERSFDK